MAIIERTYGKETNAVIDELLISSDSHVIEPEGLWKKQMPKAFKDRAPDFGGQRPNDTPAAPRTRTSASLRWPPTVSAPKSCIRPMA
jgi:hypothetical protein